MASDPTDDPDSASEADGVEQPWVGGRDLSGIELGDYHVGHRLGRGGMAEVYVAEQRSLGRRVALKVLQGRLAEDQAYIRRFQNEAKAAAALVHDNIVQIYEVGVRDGVHFIAQEYVKGQNLRQWIQRQGALTPRQCFHVLRRVASALHKAAQTGIVHRDIKPENILLGQSGEVKVADFGLARLQSLSPNVNQTQEGIAVGTPLYMSPEQVEGRAVDPRSDLYSLGATAYHMLAGRPPFEGDTALAIAVQHLRNEPKPLLDARPDLPPELCRIVHRLLAKSVEDRYQQPVELLRDLRSFAAGYQAHDSSWDADGDVWEAGVDLGGDAGPVALSTGSGAIHAFAPTRSAITMRLSTVMANTASGAPRSPTLSPWLLTAVMVTLGLPAGMAAAWWSRPRSVLAPAEIAMSRDVVRKATARDQFFHAMQEGTIDAYRAVEQYFPEDADLRNSYYVHRARQQLGEAYLKRNDLTAAEAIYQMLANANPQSDAAFAASGRIGQANIAEMRGERAAAEWHLTGLLPLLGNIPDPVRAQLRQQLSKNLRPAFDQMVRDQNGGQ